MKGLDLLQRNIGQTEISAQVVSGSYRLLPYAMEFWIEHCLLYSKSAGTSGVDRVILNLLSLLQRKHDSLAQALHHESRRHEVSANSSGTEVDEQTGPCAGWPAQMLMRDSLRTRTFVSRENCENGKGIVIVYIVVNSIDEYRCREAHERI